MADRQWGVKYVKPSEVVVTSDYRGLTTGAITGRQGRMSKRTGVRGKARMTIEITSEPLIHNLQDPSQVAQVLASAAAEAVKKKLRAITEVVKESTQLTRKYQANAYDRGETWVQKRFGGGKMGNRAPKTDEHRYFNHSGRFIESITATPNRTEGTATINVAANRLDPTTSGAGEFRFITDALIRFVPGLADPQLLITEPEVKAALDEASHAVVTAARARNLQLRDKAFNEILDMALSAVGLGGIRGKISTIYGE